MLLGKLCRPPLTIISGKKVFFVPTPSLKTTYPHLATRNEELQGCQPAILIGQTGSSNYRLTGFCSFRDNITSSMIGLCQAMQQGWTFRGNLGSQIVR